MASPSSAEATEPAEDADWKGVRAASGAQAPASVVVMNVPDVVDADALLQRFGAVLRSSGQGAKDTKEEASASSPSSSSVRFTVKTWCIDGADVPVRIAFVDITGGQHAINAIISAVRVTTLHTICAPVRYTNVCHMLSMRECVCVCEDGGVYCTLTE